MREQLLWALRALARRGATNHWLFQISYMLVESRSVYVEGFWPPLTKINLLAKAAILALNLASKGTASIVSSQVMWSNFPYFLNSGLFRSLKQNRCFPTWMVLHMFTSKFFFLVLAKLIVTRSNLKRVS